MAWKGLNEIRELVQASDRKSLARLFSLRNLVRHAILPLDYLVPGEYAKLITLTHAGEELLNVDKRLREEFDSQTLLFALFLQFFHLDLLIDERKTDADSIRSVLNEEMARRKLLLPYRFGRLLYDRFNDESRSLHTDHLDPTEALKLVADTPQGVYQVGDTVTGPFGLLLSQEVRFNPPSPQLPLWHCSDTGCGALHSVTVQRPNVPLVRALSRARAAASETLGPASEWSRVLYDLFKKEGVEKGRQYYDLPALIAEGLAEDEREILFSSLLATPRSGELRARMTTLLGEDAARGSPADLCARLSDVQRLQLLLTLPDSILVESLDRLIAGGAIRVPPYETRSTNLAPPQLHSGDLQTDISALGLRPREPKPLAHFEAAIWDAYQSSGNLDELGWRLQRRGGPPQRSALTDYLRKYSPAQALSELVLPTKPVAMAVAARVGIQIGEESDTRSLVDRIQWKFGFSPSRYEQDFVRFRDRLAQFRDALLDVGSVKSEEDRERLRSAGVNFFVSVENFLQQLVSYTVWFLGSDHFVDTRFVYSPHAASKAVSRILGASIESGGTTFAWNANALNTLGTLLVYADATAKWVTSLPSKDVTTLTRPEEDLPHFADDPDLIFRFRHTQLWADADNSALRTLSESFNRVVTQLNQSKLANVRNGLDHERPPQAFPTVDAMLLCAARVGEALELADRERFIPKTYWLKSKTSDPYGRTDYALVDYLGRELILSGPSLVASLVGIRTGRPILVGPGALLSDVGAELRFQVRHRSSYSAYWENYPRRRRIPSIHKDHSEA